MVKYMIDKINTMFELSVAYKGRNPSTYKRLTGECFMNYMLHKYEQTTLTPKIPNLPSGSVCPTCHKVVYTHSRMQ